MGRRLLSEDPEAGIREWFVDVGEDEFTIVREQVCDAIVAENRELYKGLDERAPWKGDMAHVAQVPMVIYHELQKKGILNDQKAIKAFLNDPDNRFFRTRPGKV